MADLSTDDVLKLARLARLRLSDDEVTKFKAEINEILGYFEVLNKVDVSGLEPTSQVTGLQNVTRPDEIIDYKEDPESLLGNAPAREGKYIKTKRIL